LETTKRKESALACLTSQQQNTPPFPIPEGGNDDSEDVSVADFLALIEDLW
jgi:hypothetical protein